MDNGSETESRIVVDFDSPHSTLAKIELHNVNHMQLFAIAKLLDIQGESLFMQNQMAEAQSKGKLVIARDHLPKGLQRQ